MRRPHVRDARNGNIIMKELQKLLSRARFAADKYHMIEEGDRIAVGISGGKDSLALLCTLAEMRAFYPKKYELQALSVDMGFSLTEAAGKPETDYSGIRELCRRLDVPFTVRRTEIARIIFDVRQEKNPCSLCARMRRGVLHDATLALGCNKLALGHHFDDAAITAMLNLFYVGRFDCFSPVTNLTRKGLVMIRPFIYAEEAEIKSFVRRAALPILQSPCPADGNTERAYMKKYLSDFDYRYRGLNARIVGALERGEIDGWRETER